MDAIDAARNAGVTVVVAAGNDSVDVNGSSPAGCKEVISVSAGNRYGRLAWYSNYGDVTIMAPGGDTDDKDEEGLPNGVC